MDMSQTMARAADTVASAVNAARQAGDSLAERTRLRRSVLHLGALMGWSQEEIVYFAQAVGNRQWEYLDADDLNAAIDEYRAIMQVLAARFARLRARAIVALRREEAVDGDGD